MDSAFESILQCLNLDAAGRNEGKDDILQLNIGGKKYDLKRSVFTQADLGPLNLLSCLFNKRWERLLLRDEENRIYLDWNADWIQPILDQAVLLGRETKIGADITRWHFRSTKAFSAFSALQ
jgi:hypothetical protein